MLGMAKGINMSCAAGDLPTPDFHTRLESAPGLYLFLAPDLWIVASDAAFLGVNQEIS